MPSVAAEMSSPRPARHNRIGRYAVGDVLARGGMAELYFAQPVDGSGLGPEVALKLILPHFRHDPDFLAMFRAEGRIMGRLQHPNIARVYELGVDRDEHFIAMEYIHGQSLRAIMRAHPGPVPVEVALGIVSSVCDALHYAHELLGEDSQPLGLIHRDVSPGNIVVGYDGSVRLVDFGIAKLAARTRVTRTGTIKGKAGYMSPEQCRGQPLDRRTDLFCLGVILYELVLGRRPFRGECDLSIMNAVISGDYPRPGDVDPSLASGLEAIILRALATDPDSRYASAEEFGEAIRAFAAASDCVVAGPKDVRAYVREHFGEPPRPEVDVDAPTPHWPDEVPAAPESRTMRRVATPIAWVLAAGVGALIYRQAVEPAVAEPTPATVAAEPARKEPPAEAQAQPSGVPEPEPEPEPEPPPAEPLPTADEAELAPPKGPEPKKGARNSRPRKKRSPPRTSASPAPATKAPGVTLRPPSRRP